MFVLLISEHLQWDVKLLWLTLEDIDIGSSCIAGWRNNQREQIFVLLVHKNMQLLSTFSHIAQPKLYVLM